MSRTGSLDLIDEVEEHLETMKKTQKITPVKVKSMLEHLRSSLEYLANDTFDKYKPPGKHDRSKITFPYGEKKFIDNFFANKLCIKPPSSSPMYNIFISIQDFHTGERWLSDMCSLTNEVKHRNPLPLREDVKIEQFKLEQPGFGKITAPGNVNIIFRNVFIKGDRLNDFELRNGKLEIYEKGHPLNISLIEDKRIKIRDLEYEVIPFIELCCLNLRKFINLAYDELDRIQ